MSSLTEERYNALDDESKYLWAEYETDVRRVMGGWACSDRLKTDVRDVYAGMPLSELRAEGYHRDVETTATRARAAKLPMAFSSLRIQRNIALVENLLRKEGGEQIFAREWFSFKQQSELTAVAGQERS